MELQNKRERYGIEFCKLGNLEKIAEMRQASLICCEVGELHTHTNSTVTITPCVHALNVIISKLIKWHVREDIPSFEEPYLHLRVATYTLCHKLNKLLTICKSSKDTSDSNGNGIFLALLAPAVAKYYEKFNSHISGHQYHISILTLT